MSKDKESVPETDQLDEMELDAFELGTAQVPKHNPYEADDFQGVQDDMEDDDDSDN